MYSGNETEMSDEPQKQGALEAGCSEKKSTVSCISGEKVNQIIKQIERLDDSGTPSLTIMIQETVKSHQKISLT